jgi:hypothetical protein
VTMKFLRDTLRVEISKENRLCNETRQKERKTAHISEVHIIF